MVLCAGTKGKKKGRTSSSGKRQTMVDDNFPTSSSTSTPPKNVARSNGGGDGSGDDDGNGGRGGGKSPRKKGKFFDISNVRKESNVYSIRTKNNLFIIVFTEDGTGTRNYIFPGSQQKAWATAFDRDIKDQRAWAAGTSPISCIVRRRDYREGEAEDIPLAQINSDRFPMNAYICPLGEGETVQDIVNEIMPKLGAYSAKKTNNMRPFRYRYEITRGLCNDALHALDFWIVTKDVVLFSKNLYEDEIATGEFYQFEDLLGALFERPANTLHVRETMNQFA